MKKILLIGMNPYTLDFSAPGFPPGLTAEKIDTQLKSEEQKLKDVGYAPESFLIDFGNMEMSALITELKGKSFDGIVIGAGIRIPPSNFILFEKLINTIHENAPNSKIIFDTNPLDALESIKRWL